jgi:hypothetical protein
MIDGPAGNHQARVQCSSRDTPQRMPGSYTEPSQPSICFPAQALSTIFWCPQVFCTWSLSTPGSGRLTVVEPIPEIIKTMLDEVFGCSKVEPRIDWPYVSLGGRFQLWISVGICSRTQLFTPRIHRHS